MAESKVELLVYGAEKPGVIKALDGFVLHSVRSKSDLQTITPDIAGRIRGVVVTGLVGVDGAMLSMFPKVEIVSTFGVGYDHIDVRYARDHKIIVTNTPDVLTEET